MRGQHENSRRAYQENSEELGRRSRQIFTAIALHGAMTDRQVRDHLNFKDMNSVRPRITELIKAGKLREIGSVSDVESGKTVRKVDIIERPVIQGDLI